MVTKQLDLPTILIVVCTNSYSLYEYLVKLGITKKKRLIIDIMAIRQSYERRELQEVRWINGDDNPVDAITKTKPNLSLETFINTNKLDIRVEGWVKRDGPVFTDRQNSDGSPEQEGECGQAVKRFESVFERILTSIHYFLCHMTFGLLFVVLTEEKLKAYWSARPVEAMVSTREGGIVYLYFSGYWIALNPKRSCQCLECETTQQLA